MLGKLSPDLCKWGSKPAKCGWADIVDLHPPLLWRLGLCGTCLAALSHLMVRCRQFAVRAALKEFTLRWNFSGCQRANLTLLFPQEVETPEVASTVIALILVKSAAVVFATCLALESSPFS